MVASQNQAGQTVVSSYLYTVNAIGQRTNLSQSGTAFPASRDVTWGYDILGQVTSAATSDHSADRAYQFDAIGNRLSRSAGVPPASSTATYTANALNQYSAIADPQTATVNPQFDDDGNATAYPLPVNPTVNSTLTWDAENRLTSTTVNGVATTFLYDAQSRRIAKTTGAATTLYLYDGWNVVAEYPGSAGLQPALSKTYLWGSDLSGSMQGAGGVGGLLAVRIQNQQSAIYYPTFDGNGNVSEYLTSAGAVAAHFEYDPFGNTTVNTDTPGLFNYRFSTKPLDAETGLYYYGYRYYLSPLGRWINRDTSGEKGGINLYGFVNNLPISEFDNLGMDKFVPDTSGKHGGPHVDWYDKNGNNLGRFRKYGSGIKFKGKLPPKIPNSLMSEFLEALGKLPELTLMVPEELLLPYEPDPHQGKCPYGTETDPDSSGNCPEGYSEQPRFDTKCPKKCQCDDVRIA